MVALSVAVGVVVVLATITGGCVERAACWSLVANRTAVWPGGPVAIPLLLGAMSSCVAWALASFAVRVWREARRRLDETGDV